MIKSKTPIVFSYIALKAVYTSIARYITVLFFFTGVSNCSSAIYKFELIVVIWMSQAVKPVYHHTGSVITIFGFYTINLIAVFLRSARHCGPMGK